MIQRDRIRLNQKLMVVFIIFGFYLKVNSQNDTTATDNGDNNKEPIPRKQTPFLIGSASAKKLAPESK